MAIFMAGMAIMRAEAMAAVGAVAMAVVGAVATMAAGAADMAGTVVVEPSRL